MYEMIALRWFKLRYGFIKDGFKKITHLAHIESQFVIFIKRFLSIHKFFKEEKLKYLVEILFFIKKSFCFNYRKEKAKWIFIKNIFFTKRVS